MSKEAYLFYIGPYDNSINKENKGIIPFNAFQDQGGEPFLQCLMLLLILPYESPKLQI